MSISCFSGVSGVEFSVYIWTESILAAFLSWAEFAQFILISTFYELTPYHSQRRLYGCLVQNPIKRADFEQYVPAMCKNFEIFMYVLCVLMLSIIYLYMCV